MASFFRTRCIYYVDVRARTKFSEDQEQLLKGWLEEDKYLLMMTPVINESKPVTVYVHSELIDISELVCAHLITVND